VAPDWHEWDAPPRRESQRFLLDVVGDHSQVHEVVRHDANRYTLKRRGAADREVFLTNVYILGEADYLKLRAAHPEVDLIVLASDWNSCTLAVKHEAMDDGVAVHTFKTLMRALHRKDDDDFLAFGYSPEDYEARERARWP
jgi:hypothetical protein